MSLINGALQIGRSAITASQAAITVTGNNLANAATPGYSRQNVHLQPTQYTEVAPGKYTGTGVALSDVRRQVDDALNGRIRTAVGDSASWLVQQQTMIRVEAAFNELTEQDLSTRLNAFFGAWSSLQTQPEDIATRNVVLQEGQSLTNFVRQMRSELDGIRQDLDDQVRYQVQEADSLADQIAQLNEQIVVAEAGRAGSAAALRDQRDELLKQLSELINITTREVDGGSVNVFIGNEPLIQYSDCRGLSYRESEDDSGNQLAQIIFTDKNQAVDLTGGKLQGLITARDDRLGTLIDDLDSWTQAMILEVNKIHSLGQGLDRFSSITSTYLVDDPDASLAEINDTNLPWQVDNGVFYIQMYDANGDKLGSPEMIQVKIGIDGNDTTMNSLATAINSIDNLNATVNDAGQLSIDADSGFTFGFVGPDDTDNETNVLAALGINNFFEGENAFDIAVKTGLTARQLGASANGLTGNGDIAGRIADLTNQGVASLNGISISQSFAAIVAQVATDSKGTQDNYSAADVVVQTLQLERDSISGVSIDEEAIKMITFQRSFQGGSRYISLINEMLDELIALAG